MRRSVMIHRDEASWYSLGSVYNGRERKALLMARITQLLYCAHFYIYGRCIN